MPEPESTKEQQQPEGVHLWDAIKAITETFTEQSAKAIDTYSKEVSSFVTALKEEASEAIHIQEESFKEQFGQAKSEAGNLTETLKKEATHIIEVFSDTVGLTPDNPEEEDVVQKSDLEPISSTFLTCDHAIHPGWVGFKHERTQPLLETHKQAILSNDKSLFDLYKEVVPSMISHDHFWDGWLFHKHLEKLRTSVLKAKTQQSTQPDWESWDNEDLNVEGQNKTKPQVSPAQEPKDEWVEWE